MLKILIMAETGGDKPPEQHFARHQDMGAKKLIF
jgi:hypothetical protein